MPKENIIFPEGMKGFFGEKGLNVDEFKKLDLKLSANEFISTARKEFYRTDIDISAIIDNMWNYVVGKIPKLSSINFGDDKIESLSDKFRAIFFSFTLFLLYDDTVENPYELQESLKYIIEAVSDRIKDYIYEIKEKKETEEA